MGIHKGSSVHPYRLVPLINDSLTFIPPSPPTALTAPNPLMSTIAVIYHVLAVTNCGSFSKLLHETQTSLPMDSTGVHHLGLETALGIVKTASIT